MLDPPLERCPSLRRTWETRPYWIQHLSDGRGTPLDDLERKAPVPPEGRQRVLGYYSFAHKRRDEELNAPDVIADGGDAQRAIFHR
jgi:hypothetical protein